MTRENSAEALARGLYQQAVSFDRAALSRLLTHIERDDSVAESLADLSVPPTRPSHIIGVTGAPGVGKSTLLNALAMQIANRGARVAVLLIDPSSPYSGGAILGDRLRFEGTTTHERIYVRSMANRGQTGGLAAAAPNAIDLLECTGWEYILVETVGVGQSEMDVARLVETLLVAVNPGWGDVVQAHKAGLMETPDIFVINKADRPGVDDARSDLHQLAITGTTSGWQVPICETIATDGTGVGHLIEAIDRHMAHVNGRHSTSERRSRRHRRSLTLEIRSQLEAELARWQASTDFQAVLIGLLDGSISRKAARQRFLSHLADF